ncbi:MAG: hypothetical protein JNK05_00335 [Myxococcales bacterium]|nr:hypothetical protein [Myxococcales bacterium]
MQDAGSPDSLDAAVTEDSANDADAFADVTVESSPDVIHPCVADGGVLCGTQCNTATTGTPEACGSSCTRCPTDPNGTASCAMGACALRCNATYELVAGRCLPDPPRPIEPLSTWTYNSVQPTFVITTRPDFVRYEHRLCTDRLCTFGRGSWFTTDAASRPPIPIAPNVVQYWRVTGIMSDGTERAATTVPFRLTRRATRGYDTPFFDFDGDAYADVLSCTLRSSSSPPTVSFGGSNLVDEARRLELVTSPIETGLGGEQVQPIGDFNGDGFSDVLSAVNGQRMRVAFGGPSRTAPRWSTSFWSVDPWNEWFSPVELTELRSLRRAVANLGDVNGDGFSDFASLTFAPGMLPTTWLRLFLGNAREELVATTTVTGSYLRQIVRSSQCPTTGGRRSRVVLAQTGSPSSPPYRLAAFEFTGTTIRQLADTPMLSMVGPSLEDIGDVDGDGQPETLIRPRAQQPRAIIARVVCDAAGAHRITMEEIVLPPAFVAAARSTDLDGDGTHELIFSRLPSAADPEFLRVYRNPTLSALGAPTLALRMPTPFTYSDEGIEGNTYGRWWLMQFGSPGDMDNDGADDLPVDVQFPIDTRPPFESAGSDVRVFSGHRDPAQWLRREVSTASWMTRPFTFLLL